MYVLYILYSPSRDKFYVGISANLKDRLKRHNEGRSKYTKTGTPWILAYTETFPSRSEAYQREQYIKKKKSKKFILNLIKGLEHPD